jgi:hypothetical protein
MQKIVFREWTLDKIDDAFATKQVFQHDLIDRLFSFQYILSDFELEYLKLLKQDYQLGGDDWNEVELENKFISPLIVFARISNQKFSYFLERDLMAIINDFEITGRVDGMIASGFRSPKKPFFCMHEYKRESDPTGDPKGQTLIAMMAAQAINDNKKPIYGLYVVGRLWRFLVLENKEYCFSETLVADGDDVFTIFKILKALKVTIEQLVNN